MLDVFFTVDVEVWCGGWRDLDARFPDAFRRYVYGPTPRGEFGLPFQARLLRDHGLTGVFFVEPLFATRFGIGPLTEVVARVTDERQEVQLHLHPEWVDEAREPLLPSVRGKRQHLTLYSRDEQHALVAKGLALLRQAGAPVARAFRAGSFAFNSDTLSALRTNGIAIDCSYNESMFGPQSGVAQHAPLLDVSAVEGVLEVPMTVFRDGFGRTRHTQLGACSFGELEGLLWQSLERGRKSFVVLSHNFELLNPAKDRLDEVVLKRFERLCALLDRNRESFRVRGFAGPLPEPSVDGVASLNASWHTSGRRLIEQAWRRAI